MAEKKTIMDAVLAKWDVLRKGQDPAATQAEQEAGRAEGGRAPRKRAWDTGGGPRSARDMTETGPRPGRPRCCQVRLSGLSVTSVR